MSTLLSGALCVIVRHLHLEVFGDDCDIIAQPLPELVGEAGAGSAARSKFSGNVVADIVGCLRAALFFAVNELKVRSTATSLVLHHWGSEGCWACWHHTAVPVLVPHK